jgi:hypothetical protein
MRPNSADPVNVTLSRRHLLRSSLAALGWAGTNAGAEVVPVAGARAMCLVPPSAIPHGLSRGLVQIKPSADRGAEGLSIEVEGAPGTEGRRLAVTARNRLVSPESVLIGTLVLRRSHGRVLATLARGAPDSSPIPASLSPIAAITDLEVWDAGRLRRGTPLLVTQVSGPQKGASAGVRELTLCATAAGVRLGAAGSASVYRSARGEQSMEVRMQFRKLPPGGSIELGFAHRDAFLGAFSAGSFPVKTRGASYDCRLAFGTGRPAALPAGAAPVEGITCLWVGRADTGQPLLAGAF